MRLWAVLLLVLTFTTVATGQDDAVHGDVASVTSADATLGPVVPIGALDPDVIILVGRLLAVRGFYEGEPVARANGALDGALRRFARSRGLPPAPREGEVTTRTIDELGAGEAAALRWYGTGPRAPELTRDQTLRLNRALYDRGYLATEPEARVDMATLVALRRFQADTGHPVQQGDVIERRWLFILGVASE